MENENNAYPEIHLDFGQPAQQPYNNYPAQPNNFQQQYVTAPYGQSTGLTDDSMLNDNEKRQVKEFARKINLRDSNQILQYGAASQKKMSDFSESTLSKIMTKDSGEVGNMLTNLTVELKGFSIEPEQKKGFFGNLLKKSTDQIETLKTKYTSVEKNVNRIADALESHKIQLLKDITMLDKMYDSNLIYYKELTMYILAGKERLADALNNELPALKQRASQSGLPQDAQAARDFEDMCNRFDKKLVDLELTRTISIQTAPQIRMIQGNDNALVEKIHTSIMNTIPLWKNQMVLALGLANSQKALDAQRAVTNATNELLKKNADLLKTGSVEIAKENERNIIDIETIEYTNQSLISTLEEVMQIQEEGRQNRRNVEERLSQMEEELKQKLLSVSR